MREVLPADPEVERPVSEELKKESRAWVEAPRPPLRSGPAEQAAEQPRAVRYDLD